MSDSVTLMVEARVLGSRKPIAAGWSVPVPQAARAGGDQAMTLRELLALIVADEVSAFQQRQRERRLPLVMTRGEIERSAATGKIVPGDHEPQDARPEDAIETALQAFADGLYLVLLDGERVNALESVVALREDSRLTFVRLVALIGG